MSTRLQAKSRRLGRRTKGTAKDRTIQSTSKSLQLNGSSKFNILDDISLQERYALTFFSKCLFPNLCQRSSWLELRAERRSTALKGRIGPITLRQTRIFSQERYYSMITLWWLARLR